MSQNISIKDLGIEEGKVELENDEKLKKDGQGRGQHHMVTHYKHSSEIQLKPGKRNNFQNQSRNGFASRAENVLEKRNSMYLLFNKELRQVKSSRVVGIDVGDLHTETSNLNPNLT